MDVALLRRRGLAGLVLLAVVGGAGGGVAGCGGASTSRATTSRATASQAALPPATGTTSTTSPARRRLASSPRRPRGARLGTAQTLRVGRAVLTVTVEAVLDPLGDADGAVGPGRRAVGARLRLSDTGATYDSTASGDVALVTAGGTAAPLFVGHGVCATPLTDFESLVSAGETRDGCVAFALPGRARVLAVVFRPHARAAGSVTWRVPSRPTGSGG